MSRDRSPGQLGPRHRNPADTRADPNAVVQPTLPLALVTSDISISGDPACLSIFAGTPDGRGIGVVCNGVVSCPTRIAVFAGTVVETLGILTPAIRTDREAYLTAARGLPCPIGSGLQISALAYRLHTDHSVQLAIRPWCSLVVAATNLGDSRGPVRSRFWRTAFNVS